MAPLTLQTQLQACWSHRSTQAPRPLLQTAHILSLGLPTKAESSQPHSLSVLQYPSPHSNPLYFQAPPGLRTHLVPAHPSPALPPAEEPSSGHLSSASTSHDPSLGG